MVIKDASVYSDNAFVKKDYNIDIPDDVFFSVDASSSNIYVLPAFCDVHVHFREPGFSYKETIASGTAAAARGGYSDVCTMPNLNPVPDCKEAMEEQLDIIKRDAVVNVHPYASVTVGERGEALSDMDALSAMCIAFSDDGRGVQSEDMMRRAMLKAKKLNKIIAAHCEDNSLLRGGYIHDGEYARLYGHRGICSESEWRPIERDIRLARETGCAYHVCHVSCAESVELIRQAKRDGVNITCETAPHYLVLNDMMLEEDGGFKMNPPIRSERDRQALIEGIKDGTVDMIATDHAPHSAAEKSAGLEKSLMGVVGLETAFPVLYTYLVKEGVITLERLVELMAINPRKRFGIKQDGICVYDLGARYTIDTEKFLTKGRSTPFSEMTVYGENIMTVIGGKIAWRK